MSALVTDDKTEIRKNIFRLVIPVILENILSLLANFITSSMLGHLDDYGLSSVMAVSAQGIASQVSNIIWYLFKGLSIGGTIMISQALGGEDELKAQNLSRTLIKTELLLSVPMTLFIYFGAEPILRTLFDPESEILAMGTEYLRIMALLYPALAVMLSSTGIMQGRGDTRTPMFITLIFNVINILAGFPLILGKPFGIVQGTRGAALALLLAHYLTAVLDLIIMFRPNGILNLDYVDKEDLNPFFSMQGGVSLWKNGIPSSFENIFWQISSIIMGVIFMSFGEVAYTANQLGLQAEGLTDMPAIGFGIASTTLVGQLVGAKEYEIGKEYIDELRRMALIFVAVGSAFLLIFPEQIMGLLTSNQEVIALGKQYLIIMGCIQIPQNLQRIYTGALKGAGKTIWPMIIAGVGIWCIRVPLALLIWKLTSWPVYTLWLVVAVDQITRYILSLTVYKKADIWKLKKVDKETADEIEAEIDAEIDGEMHGGMGATEKFSEVSEERTLGEDD